MSDMAAMDGEAETPFPAADGGVIGVHAARYEDVAPPPTAPAEPDPARAGLVSALELLGATATRLKRIEYTVGRITDDGIRSSLAHAEERRLLNEKIDTLEARIVDLERIHRKAVAMLRLSNDQYLSLTERLNQIQSGQPPLVQTAPEPPLPSVRPPSFINKVADMLSLPTPAGRR